MKSAALRNIIIFQAGWWITAFLVSAGQPWISLLTSVGLVALHFFLNPGRREIFTVLAFAALGYGMDCGFSAFGLIAFEPHWDLPIPHPWLMGLWLLFASTFNHSLAWVFEVRWLSVLLGAALGPLTYYLVGDKFHVLSFTEPYTFSVGCYALSWAIFMFIVGRTNETRK